MKEIGRTKFLILGLLAEAPCTGYDIRRITLSRFRFFWNESFGQIYPALKSMVEAGLIGVVESRAVDPRGKRLYAIREEGRIALMDWLAGDTQAETARMESILKYYFSWAADGRDVPRIVGDFMARQEANLSELRAMKKELESIPDLHRNHGLALATLELGLSTYAAWKAWGESILTAGDNSATKEGDRT